MTVKEHKKFLGLSPRAYGLTSLAAACLALVTGLFLLPALGWVLWMLVLAALVVTTIVGGVVGIGAGIYHRDAVAVGIAVPGFVIVGVAIWSVASAVMHF